MINELLRSIPSVHDLQKDTRFIILTKKYNMEEEVLTNIFRKVLETIRGDIRQGNWMGQEIGKEIWDRTHYIVEEKNQFRLRKVINATGTILHTNLGRARLGREAIERVVEVATGYSNLEYNIDSGTRGSRHDLVESLLKEVTGAEAAMVVNNNAAAVYLVLKALAKKKEVIVSRGQLVEIGGSFRISSIMEESGAVLVEVGTTNKTHLEDYKEAITAETVMLLKVHTSNFKTIGFTKSVAAEELAELASNYDNLVVYEDLGSGVLYDFAEKGIGDEPLVQQVLESGVDIVSFSGDKLLGGPQAGIIAGKKKYIDLLKKHQLARVLRVDKMTFAALEATLQAYLSQKEKDIPAVRDLLLSPDDIREKADIFLASMGNCSFEFEAIESESMVGGGTMPDVTLPSAAVRARHPALSAQAVAEILRKGTPSIVVRIQDQHVMLDFRTITQGEIPTLVRAFQRIELTYRD
jgi:L-seryl-tRNA(Ser) seleniumtransferase